MTTPPNRNADDADDARRAATSHSDTQANDAPKGYPHERFKRERQEERDRETPLESVRPTLAKRLRAPLVFVVTFAALALLHSALLNLPYYWDEAGYFIPAARDIYTDGSFAPHSTLSNAPPPLVMAYLALESVECGTKEP